jgi:cytochrome c553
MAKLSPLVTEPELAAAAAYFSALALRGPRAEVIETERLPGTRAVAWIYATTDALDDEPLGERIVEMPRDLALHELRDPNTRYVAYVPPGSVARGRTLATEGGARFPACTSCHGADLRGVGLVPPIAGRSPTYLLRQLVAFRTGARATAAGQPMQPVVAQLELDEMIAMAAYTATLAP